MQLWRFKATFSGRSLARTINPNQLSSTRPSLTATPSNQMHTSTEINHLCYWLALLVVDIRYTETARDRISVRFGLTGWHFVDYCSHLFGLSALAGIFANSRRGEVAHKKSRKMSKNERKTIWQPLRQSVDGACPQYCRVNFFFFASRCCVYKVRGLVLFFAGLR